MKRMPALAATILDFTIPQRIHNCPKTDGPPLAATILNFTIPQRIRNYSKAGGIQWPTGPWALGPGPRLTVNEKNAPSSSNYPRLHNPPTNSQLPKSGWGVSTASQRFPEVPKGFQRLPEVPRRFQGLPEAPRGSQGLPEASGGSPGVLRGFQRLPEVLRGSQRFPELPPARSTKFRKLSYVFCFSSVCF
jgi:hypothetical protein